MQIYSVFLRRALRNLRTLLAFAMLVAATMLSTPMRAQTLRDYEFSTGVDASKWITTSDWTSIVPSGITYNLASTVNNIGFSFPFGDSTYTQFSVNSNGIFRLGSEATLSYEKAGMFDPEFYTRNNPKISGEVNKYGLGTGTDGYIRYAVTGTTPNRVLVCEYCMAPYQYSVSAQIIWQVQLHETTGEVTIVYGSTTPSYSISYLQTGLATSPTDIVLLSPDTHTPVYSNTHNNTVYNTWHGTNRYYSFMLPNSTCPRPESIAVSDIGTSSLTATWVDNGGATQWEVRLDSRNVQGTPVVVNTPTYTFTGLTNGTDYSVRVRGICGPGDTTAVRSRSAQTLCGYLQLPYSEGFEDALGTLNTANGYWPNNLPNCWDYNNEGSDWYMYPYVINGSSHSGTKCMHSHVNRITDPYTSPQYAFLPLTDSIRHPVNSLELSYWMRRQETAANGKCIIGITPDPTDINTFIPVDSAVSNNNIWIQKTVHFNNYTGPHGRVTMLFPKNSNNNWTWIDDINLFSHNSFDTVTHTACNSYTWPENGTTYTNSGTYNHTLPNAEGYDSIITLQLTIYHSYAGDTTAAVCDSITWRGNYYMESGNYIDTIFLSPLVGCDSTATLHLTVNHRSGLPAILPGATESHFSVSSTQTVQFSKGNLQYQASTGLWRFAEHQYDYVGDDNTNISSTYDGWIDLFGWGTSGWNSGATEYQPYSSFANSNRYQPGGNASNDLTGSYAEADWGWHNAIQNGGNRNHLWRTLIHTEWEYLFNTRTTNTNLGTPNARYAKASVNGTKGVILFPDEYTHPANVAVPLGINATDNTGWDGNTYSTTDWDKMDSAGAVFLPAARMRNGIALTNIGLLGGYYWAADRYNDNNSHAHMLKFNNTSFDPSHHNYRYLGISVRPVHNTDPVIPNDTVAEACDSFSWWNTNYTNSTNTPTHLYTTTAGCDSLVTLHLTINHSSTGDTTATACDSFTWWGTTYTSSTNTATHTFTNAAGCDSVVTLHLTIKNSTTGDTTVTTCNSFSWWNTNYTNSTNSATHNFTNSAGCDSVVTLHLTINHSNTGDTFTTACNSFTWWNTNYTNSTNSATHTFTNAAGCDSVVTLHLTINNSNTGDTNATACNSFTWWNTNYTNSTNSATHNFTNSAGCDSTVTLHLTINHSNTGDTTATACDNFNWWNTNYTNSTNSATHTYTNAAGCDSVVTLHLTINHSNTGDTTATACNSFTWWGNSFTSSTNTATHTFTNAAGCDSMVTLHLTINHPTTGDTTAIACNSFTWWGTPYSTTGDYVRSWPSTIPGGCDSVVTMHLTINHSNTGDTTATACNSFTWWGNNYTSSTNTATHTFTNVAGCDSVVTLHLTINHPTTGDTTAIACNSFTWWGTPYSSTGDYVRTWPSTIPGGCDSVVTLHLTVNYSNTGIEDTTVCNSIVWHGTEYNASTNTPTFTCLNAAGCDSVTTLHLTVNQCSSTTVTTCDSYTWRGHTYTATGIYTDGTDTLYLTVNLSNTGDSTVTACNSFTWWGTNYTSSTNSATHTFSNAAGCDSVVTLHLTINHATTGDTTAIACDSFTWWGTNYTNSTNSATHTFTNAAGCDSTVTLHLTINHSNTGDTSATACEIFTWWNTNYTSSTNSATHTFTNVAGCDSVVTLHLTINHSTTGDTTVTACESFSWWGTTYTTTGNYVQTGSSTIPGECDSTVTLHLTINHANTSDTFATACDSLTWWGTNYNTTGNYVRTWPSTIPGGCDSTVTLHLTIYHSHNDDTTAVVCDSITWRGDHYSRSGNYIDTISLSPLGGCDSTVTLHLTVNHSNGLPDILPGATESIFSVSSTQTVQFSKGNLQYQASTGLWRFAEHQYDYVGSDNTNISSTYDGWIDLFGWGTSGWNSGATAYQPYSSHTANNYYYPGGSENNDLTGDYAEADWGWHNAIQNGGNRNHLWRTLLHYEWAYLFNNRTTNTNLGTPNARYAKASINGTHGVIIFPDEYTHPADVTVPVGINATDSTGWDGNSYSTTDWNKMDSAGAVFLPAAGYRSTNLDNSEGGQYWAADKYIDNNSFVYRLIFNRTELLDPYGYGFRWIGRSVRPVHNTDLGITNDTVAEACESYSWYGTTYTSSGDYVRTWPSAIPGGCDSVVTLHLTINLSATGDTTATACDSLTWWGTNHTTTGDFMRTWPSTIPGGCDSTVTLHLTINHSNTSDTFATACDSLTWWGTNYTTTGDFMRTWSSALPGGCDSTVTLHLTINTPVVTEVYDTACESYTWHGTTYSVSGDFHRTGISMSPENCDTTETLHLKLIHATYNEIADSFCTGTQYLFGSQTLTESGLYADTLTAANSCDSIVSLNLTKLPQPFINIVQSNDCQTQTHHIRVETDVDYLYWTCNEQSWNSSWGSVHAHNLTVSNTLPITLTLLVDYNEYPTCPNTAVTTLQPIVQPQAVMDVSPEFITHETPTLVALSQSTGAKRLQWYIDGDDAGDSQRITYTPESGYDSVVVTLIAFSDLCSDTAERVIPIKQQTLYVPNAFTPNESTNKTFSIFYDGIIEYQLYIYNRQGIQVFHSNTNGEEWDGRYNGTLCPQGSYVWLVKYRSEVDPQNWHYSKGTVTLLY